MEMRRLLFDEECVCVSPEQFILNTPTEIFPDIFFVPSALIVLEYFHPIESANGKNQKTLKFSLLSKKIRTKKNARSQKKKNAFLASIAPLDRNFIFISLRNYLFIENFVDFLFFRCTSHFVFVLFNKIFRFAKTLYNS